MPRIQYYDDKKVTLKKHHVKSSVLTRLNKGYISVYDITEKDMHNQARITYIKYAEEKSIPVLLFINGVTRLLIFNRAV